MKFTASRLRDVTAASLPHLRAAQPTEPRVKQAVNYRKRQWPKRQNNPGSFHVKENRYNVDIKIPVCQIIGPAAAGSAEYVLRPYTVDATNW